MLTQEVKRKIDTARDILVGKVPDPKAQVEQITTALIYKFMDDMDKESMSLPNGKARFFTNGFEKYAWTKLLDPKLGGHDRLDLYMEAITKLSLNPHIPQLFRDIFKDTFLPYRNPETLSLFLKEINGFTYEHSEDLGDSFEYLLSILGSQGDAGQFRTPRHIIDFIVKCVDPKKDDVICDPACGTAGFLISAYKHILKQHDGVDDPNKKEKPLSPDERKSLMDNFVGYDISPDMVKLSKVNLYLHGFPNPTIYEYDTLTSEERWDDSFDVMLANPPFMTPKGGIKPHKRFSIQANRSEVLFVDYILEHLRLNGRAGIIVPEGIIFQSANAYKSLRKKLVEDGLYCVVSLPAGVFQPYSGVKTSILLFDKEISKKTNDILFVKIENDGFDLGAQRKVIDKNDLPIAVNNINDYRNYVLGLSTNNSFIDFIKRNKKVGDVIFSTYANYSIVSKNVILATKEVILTSNRYKEDFFKKDQKWPISSIGDKDLFQIESGGTPDSSKKEYWNGGVYWATLADLPQDERITIINNTKRKITKLGLKKSSAKILPINSIIVSSRATIGRIAITKVPLATNQGFKNIIIKDFNKVNPEFLANILTQRIEEMKNLSSGGTFKEISKTNFSTIKIVLPSFDIQTEIVKEIESYQKIIDGAKQVVENWKPKIAIDFRWEKIRLGKVCDVRDGTHDSPKQVQEGYPLITSKNIKDGRLVFSNTNNISEEDFQKVSKRSYVDVGDIIMPMIGTIGGACLIKSKEIEFAIKNVALFKKSKQIIPEYLLNILNSDLIRVMFENQSTGATQKFVSLGVLRNLEISLPPMDIQKQIVEKINREQEIVYANKALIDMFEQNIKDIIAKLWNE